MSPRENGKGGRDGKGMKKPKKINLDLPVAVAVPLPQSLNSAHCGAQRYSRGSPKAQP